jgi:MYXO-CTERM domain-containing protein
MNTQKILLPTISVGLLITAREVTASVMDFGLIAESLTVAGTLFGNTITGNTIGGYTLGGLTFVGSHLNDLINGQTVSAILADILGPQNNGTATFNVLGDRGASGRFVFNGGYTVTNGGVTLSPLPVNATLTSCTPATPAGGLPGCLTIGGAQVPLNPYDPAGLIVNLERAQILALPFGLSNGATVTSSFTATIPLGSLNGVDFQGEEILTEVHTNVAGTPEPASWSLAAVGVAVLGWWRRRQSRRK